MVNSLFISEVNNAANDDCWSDQFIFFLTNIQLTVRNATIQADEIDMPYQMLVDWETPQPLSMMSAMIWVSARPASPAHLSCPVRPPCEEISGPPSSSTAWASPPAARWSHTATCGGSRSRWRVWWRPLTCCRLSRGKIQNSCRPGLGKHGSHSEISIRRTPTYPGTKSAQRTMQLGRDTEFEIWQTLLSTLSSP